MHTKKVRCENCGQSFANKPNLNRHLKENPSCGQNADKGGNSIKIDFPEIKCENCDRVFFRKYDLEQHIEKKICTKDFRNDLNSEFQCFGCLKTFSNKGNLEAHRFKVKCITFGVQFDPTEVFESDKNDFILSQI